MQPDAGQIRLAVGAARRRSGEVRLSVFQPRYARIRVVEPLRACADREEKRRDEQPPAGVQIIQDSILSNRPPPRNCVLEESATISAVMKPQRREFLHALAAGAAALSIPRSAIGETISATKLTDKIRLV